MWSRRRLVQERKLRLSVSTIPQSLGKRIRTRTIPMLDNDELFNFMENVSIPDDNGCWLWTGPCQKKGYGMFRIRGNQFLSHRVSYQQCNGRIPDGYVIDHTCNNKSCVNPAHLEAVTSKENTLRGTGPTAINARTSTCLNGHLLEGDNLRVIVHKDGNPRRVCIACRRQQSVDRHRKKGPPTFSAWQVEWLKDHYHIDVSYREESK